MKNILNTIQTTLFILGLICFQSAYAYGSYGKNNIKKAAISESQDSYVLNFKNKGYEKERDVVSGYYRSKWQDLKVIPLKAEFGIDLYDIDGDGEKEIFVLLKLPSNRDYFALLKRNKIDKKYEEVCWVNEGGEPIIVMAFDSLQILNTKTFGFNDIRGFFAASDYATWKWDGSCYRLFGR